MAIAALQIDVLTVEQEMSLRVIKIMSLVHAVVAGQAPIAESGGVSRHEERVVGAVTISASRGGSQFVIVSTMTAFAG